MALESIKLVKKPLHVTGVQVTKENMEEVAKWCGGEVRVEESAAGRSVQKYIKVQVRKPLNEKQTKAYPGDWVLTPDSPGSSHKVYTDRALRNNFDFQSSNLVVAEVDPEMINILADKVIAEINRPQRGLIRGDLMK